MRGKGPWLGAMGADTSFSCGGAVRGVKDQESARCGCGALGARSPWAMMGGAGVRIMGHVLFGRGGAGGGLCLGFLWF